MNDFVLRIALAPIALAVVVVAWGAYSAPTPGLQTAEEIVACNEANFPQSSSVQNITMQVSDSAGAITTTKAEIYWKKLDDGLSGVLVRLFEPLDVRGSAFLMLEKEKRNDLFVYLPELGNVRRVHGRMMSTSLFGTDISYGEFEHIQSMAESSSAVRQADSDVDGRPSYVVEVRPTEAEESAYERIRTFIDQETCITLRAEFYERGEEARKVFSADVSSLTAENDGIWIARRYAVHDKRDSTETAIVVDSVEIGKHIPRKMFSQRELLRGGR
jgi:hypothetical protein